MEAKAVKEPLLAVTVALAVVVHLVKQEELQHRVKVTTAVATLVVLIIRHRAVAVLVQ